MNSTKKALWEFGRWLAIPASIVHAACMLIAVDDGSFGWAAVFALILAYLIGVILIDW